VAGPALGGGLLYMVGTPTLYALCCAMFLLASLFVAAIRIEVKPPPRQRVTIESLFAGLVFVRHHPVLLGVMTLDLFAVLLGGATALLPVYARDILATESWGLGLLRAAPGVGAVLTAVLLAHRPIRRRAGGLLFATIASFGVATVVFGVSRSLPLSLMALALLGASDMVSVVIRFSLVQVETPDAMRGRVNAINSMFIGTSNQLGEFRAGSMAAGFGVVPAVLIGGIGTVLVVALWMHLFPALRRIDQLEPGS
jgi:Transmembrane secretion effector